MASNYTCKACSRALSRPTAITSLANGSRRKCVLPVPQPHRSLSTSQLQSAQASEAQKKKKGRTLHGELGGQQPPTPRARLISSDLRKHVPQLTETYVAYGATEKLLQECSRPGEYTIPQSVDKNGEIPEDENGVHIGVGKGWWYESLGLQPNFNNWAQITFMHMYMLQVRFRMLPESHATPWIQHMTNHAFYAAEDRLVVWHKMHSATIRQKFLKDAFAQWRGVLLAYDEGLIKSDAMLAAAVWRNLLSGREDVDFEKLAQIVGYMRKEIKRLVLASNDEVLTGAWKFEGDPGDEKDITQVMSRALQQREAPVPKK
ncbi:hypothetical protein K504DRAFT_396143 [Pleomassaria siparia CBS 279.74]|uniref:Ubiquinol-cytochrome c chaperone domain-containing protein n=1 Tax=Pleomassaria siparia CBS 279.74 TaxID=1314801 RepID=A0A6G1KR70_9PLEO|nr:hypothetical protein K504DRAFT_396143 [Pleomassaria siparia CBS 279.74]